jgi:hypothetical protein
MKKLILFLLVFLYLTPIAKAQCWKSISAGYTHTLGLKQDGSLWAWGDNIRYGLGDSTRTDRVVPTLISRNNNWKTIIAGSSNSFALKNDGTLWAWGNNSYVDLGNSNNTIDDLKVPTQIGTANDWKTITRGVFHTFGIKNNGALWIWGNNWGSQLGLGTLDNIGLPTQLGTDINWQSAKGGNLHTLAIKSNGTLWAWGNNNNGQIGNGTTADSPLPVQIGTETNWQSLECGTSFSLALKTDGTLWGWGLNDQGQLGDGTSGLNNKQITRKQIGSANNWLTISAGQAHVIAIKKDGTLWSWGSNIKGQLGDGTTTDKYFPTQIGTDNDWANVSTGEFHSFATKKNGAIYFWGWNNAGQLGDGSTTDKPTPQLACLQSDVKSSREIPLKLYPNPTNGQISIGGNLPIDSEMQLFNSVGKMVKKLKINNKIIDLSEIPNGMYWVQISNGQTYFVKPIIKM